MQNSVRTFEEAFQHLESSGLVFVRDLEGAGEHRGDFLCLGARARKLAVRESYLWIADDVCRFGRAGADVRAKPHRLKLAHHADTRAERIHAVVHKLPG